ncbi:MAG: histidine kinase [Bacteroidota bacterium]
MATVRGPGACQPKAVQIFTAKDGITMTKRPSYLTIDQQGVIWFGTDNGLLSFDGFNFKTVPIPNSDIRSLPYSVVAYNYQDRTGTYWSVFYKDGLYNYDPVSKTFTPFVVPPDVAGKLRLDSVDTRFPFEDSKDNLWIQICGYGLLRINEKTKATRVYRIIDPKQTDFYISGSWMNTFYEHADGTLYIGTNDGMVVLNPETGTYTIHKETNDNPLPECRCILTKLEKGNGDNIFCSTWGNGIKVFNTVTKTFTTHLIETGGKPCESNVIIDLFRLTDTTLFVLKRDAWEKSGFCIYNTRTSVYTPIKGVEPKFTWREYNEVVKDGDFLWVPNLSQLYRFYIPALREYKTLAQATIPDTVERKLRMMISGFWINGIEQKTADTALHLTADQKNFRIQFGCTGATMQDSIRFAYKLDGVDKNWNRDYQPSLQYNALPPGNYTLHIKVDEAPYRFTQKELKIPVTIEAYWWQTLWFRVLVCMGLTALVYVLYRQRIRQISRQALVKTQYERRLAEVEMKALRAQMNPHFIFNCLNSINRYIVKSDHKTASGYLTKFSKLIRLILDNSSTDIISLQTEIDTLELYIQMEAMRFHNSFDYSIETAEGINTMTTHIPSMLVQPYIENAIWHGLLHKTEGKAMMRVRFINAEKKSIRIEIEDNGIGRVKAKELRSRETLKTKSYGMQISSDRIKLINDLYNMDARVSITDLYDEQGNACGTKVVIELPLIKS